MVPIPPRRRRGNDSSPRKPSRALLGTVIVMTAALTFAGAFLAQYLSEEVPDQSDVVTHRVTIDSVSTSGRYDTRGSKEVFIHGDGKKYDVEQWLWSGQISQDSLIARLRRAGTCAVHMAKLRRTAVVGIDAPEMSLPLSVGLAHLQSEHDERLYVSLVACAIAIAALVVVIAEIRGRRRRRNAATNSGGG